MVNGVYNFFNTPYPLKVIGYSKPQQTLTLDLQHVISTYPSLEIWELLELRHIITHYEGLGILPNVFSKYIDKSIVETYLPVYYTGVSNLFTFNLQVFTQANPLTPVPVTSNSGFYFVAYTLKLVSSPYYIDAPPLPLDMSSLISYDTVTLQISQPVLDLYSPGVYELNAVFQDSSSLCHKINRTYTFELNHILTSFVVDMDYTFTMGEDLKLQITTITPILPTFAMKEVYLILCVPQIPNNQITDPLICTKIIGFPTSTKPFVHLKIDSGPCSHSLGPDRHLEPFVTARILQCHRCRTVRYTDTSFLLCPSRCQI